MKTYYSLFWKEGKDPISSAFAPAGTKLAHDLIEEVCAKGELPFDFNLVKVSVGKNGLIISDDLADVSILWPDYLPNSLAWPLMSERMKSIIERYVTDGNEIDWIKCKVKYMNEEHLYYILRFKKILDVLNVSETMFVKGTDNIIKPVFSYSKIETYHIFYRPVSGNLWKITSALYISEILKKVIKKEKLTGVDFDKIKVV